MHQPSQHPLQELLGHWHHQMPRPRVLHQAQPHHCDLSFLNLTLSSILRLHEYLPKDRLDRVQVWEAVHRLGVVVAVLPHLAMALEEAEVVQNRAALGAEEAARLHLASVEVEGLSVRAWVVEGAQHSMLEVVVVERAPRQMAPVGSGEMKKGVAEAVVGCCLWVVEGVESGLQRSLAAVVEALMVCLVLAVGAVPALDLEEEVVVLMASDCL